MYPEPSKAQSANCARYKFFSLMLCGTNDVWGLNISTTSKPKKHLPVGVKISHLANLPILYGVCKIEATSIKLSRAIHLSGSI